MQAHFIYLGAVICLLQVIVGEMFTRYFTGLLPYTCPGTCVNEHWSLFRCISRCSLSECRAVNFNLGNKTCCECSTGGRPQKMPGNILFVNMREKFCFDDLVGEVPDSSLTASSVISGNTPSRGRLNTVKVGNMRAAWVPSSPNNRNDYIQVMFEETKEVFGVATQGRNGFIEWIQCTSSYKVSFSVDCDTFSFIEGQDNNIMEFPANDDRDTIVENLLPVPVYALCVRVYPVTYMGYPVLRFGILGLCKI